MLAVYKKVGRRKGYGYQHGNALYQDEDGSATEKSQEEFSTIIPRSIALIASLGGLLVSIAASVLRTTDEGDILFIESWVTSGSWVRGALQGA